MGEYAFQPEVELKSMGEYKAVPKMYGMPGRTARKFNTPITPKENFLRMARKEKPLWVPNVSAEFNNIQPMCMLDAEARCHGGMDWFGIEWEYEPRSNAAMVKPGTRRLSDITNWREELVWPDLQAIDWKKNYEEVYAPVMEPDRPTNFAIVNGCFERLGDLTSFADCLVYLIEEEEEVNALFEKFTDMHIELMKIAKEVYGADLITFHDDMGTQRSTFMSPNMFHEIMLPHYKRMNQAAHDMGLYVNYHSCGCVGTLIPYYIEAGFDFWEGQDNCNNKKELLDKYGDQLGQLSVYTPNPNCTDEEYIAQIEENIKTMGSSGRYLCWYVPTKPDCKLDAAEAIYVTGRKLMCGEA